MKGHGNCESNRHRRALDAALVIGARAGDAALRDALVRRWHRRLVAHGWRLTGDPALAEEAVQAAWIDILRGLPQLRDEAAFAAWAFRIVTRKVAAGIGGRVAARDLTAALASEAATLPDEASLDDHAERADLRAAVATLPPGHRAAVALHYFEELSIAEVAVALGVPSGTVKTRLMHARARLRRILEGEGHG
jgi:RNA polymerase sigma-70 factor (ECF subfamily)